MFTIVIFSFAPKTMEERKKKKTFSHIVVFIQRQFIATMQCNAAIQAVRMFNHIQNTTQQNARDVFFFFIFLSVFVLALHFTLVNCDLRRQCRAAYRLCINGRFCITFSIFTRTFNERWILYIRVVCVCVCSVWACNRNMHTHSTVQTFGIVNTKMLFILERAGSLEPSNCCKHFLVGCYVAACSASQLPTSRHIIGVDHRMEFKEAEEIHEIRTK